jgi:PhzF family phenazine biosynthesis protein
MPGLRYTHADVFSAAPYCGNSLPVFVEAGGLTTEQMQRITRELRHFEAIFLEATATPDAVRARIFDLFEELPFAGHPLIGAAAVLHTFGPDADVQTWQFHLGSRVVGVTTRRCGDRYYGLLDQGTPKFQGEVARPDPFARAFTLAVADLHPDLPLEVVSTGLPYLIVPVRSGALEPHVFAAMSRRFSATSARSSRCCSTRPTTRYGIGATTAPSRTPPPAARQVSWAPTGCVTP